MFDKIHYYLGPHFTLLVEQGTLTEPTVYLQILRQIHFIISDGAQMCPNEDLECRISEADKTLFYKREAALRNPLEVFEKVVRSIKIVQMRFEKDRAQARNFRVNKLKK